MMSGVDGQYFKEFGLTVAFAVLLSLLVSFTLTPMMAALYLPVGKPAMPTFLKQPWQRFQTAFTALEAWYRGVLHHILEHERKRVMAGAVALLVVSLFVLTQIGQEFTPTSDQSQFTLRVNAPRSESVTAAGQDLEAVRAALAEVPGVLHVYQRSDTQDANFFVQLVPKADRDRTQDEIVRDCRARVNALAGFQADVTIGYDKPVALSITGDDAAQLEAISHEVEGVLRTIPGVRDVTSSVRTGASELKIVRNDAMANELGVTPAAIGETLGTMLQGTVVGKFSDKDEQVDIRLRLDGGDRATSAMLQNVFVPASDNKRVPLAQVARIEQDTASGSVRRYDRKKEVRLTANLENTSLSDFEEAFADASADIDLPPGYAIGAAGESDDMDEAFSDLVMAMVMAVVLIFLVLAAQFESYSEPFAIMLSLPLALIGAIWGLYLANSTISMVSLIGIIMLLGLVTKNAILLIDVARKKLAEGKTCVEALADAGALRLRPILMTSLAMIFGMLPIALGTGSGAELRAPMAYAIIGGIVTSTILTLVIVPIAYTWIYHLGAAPLSEGGTGRMSGGGESLVQHNIKEGVASAGAKVTPSFLHHNMLPANIPWLPIRIRQRVNPHALAGARVNELAAAEVDAAVGGPGLVCREEDEVAGFELARALCARAELVLIVGEARDGDAVFREDVLQVARAVERLRRRATEAVGRADVVLGRLDDGIHFAARQNRRVVRRERAFDGGRRFRFLGRLDVDAPGLRAFHVLERAPRRGIDDARDMDVLVALELRDGTLRAAAIDAVGRAGRVADFHELLLQQQDVVAVRASLERRRSERRARRDEQREAEEQEDFFRETMLLHGKNSFPYIKAESARAVLSRAGRGRGPAA